MPRYPGMVLMMIFSLILVFFRNCWRMSAFERKRYHSNNIMPEKTGFICCFCNQPDIRELGEGQFFKTSKSLVYPHIVLDACNVFPLTVSKLITYSITSQQSSQYTQSSLQFSESSGVVSQALYSSLPGLLILHHNLP